MKKKSNIFLPILLFSCVVVLSVACSKDSNSGTAITKENIAGSYLLTGLTASIAGSPAQNIYDSIPACQRDDIYKLNLDFSMDYIDAGTKCVPPGDSVGTWSLSGTTITIGSDSGKIQSFNGKTMVVTSTLTIFGIVANTTETFTKQ